MWGVEASVGDRSKAKSKERKVDRVQTMGSRLGLKYITILHCNNSIPLISFLKIVI